VKDAKVVGRHKKDCWFRRDDRHTDAWYLDTWMPQRHESMRGQRVIYLLCNCPECPARLRVKVRMLERYAVAALAKTKR